MASTRTGWCPPCAGWERLECVSVTIMPPSRWRCDHGHEQMANVIRWRPADSGAASKAGGSQAGGKRGRPAKPKSGGAAVWDERP